jgi:hypothetical protein
MVAANPVKNIFVAANIIYLSQFQRKKCNHRYWEHAGIHADIKINAEKKKTLIKAQIKHLKI